MATAVACFWFVLVLTRVDMCADMCVKMNGIGVCTEVCTDVCTDMHTDTRVCRRLEQELRPNEPSLLAGARFFVSPPHQSVPTANAEMGLRASESFRRDVSVGTLR